MKDPSPQTPTPGWKLLARALNNHSLPLAFRLTTVKKAEEQDIEHVYRLSLLGQRRGVRSTTDPHEMRSIFRNVAAPLTEHAAQLMAHSTLLTGQLSAQKLQAYQPELSFIGEAVHITAAGHTQYCLPAAADRCRLLELAFLLIGPFAIPGQPPLEDLLWAAYRLAHDNEGCEESFTRHPDVYDGMGRASRLEAEREALLTGEYPYWHG